MRENSDETLQIALDVLNEGLVEFDSLQRALKMRRSKREPIGKLLLKHRDLSMEQVLAVLNHQAVSPDKPFGVIAVELGFVSQHVIDSCLQEQSESTISLIEVLINEGLILTIQANQVLDRVHARIRGSEHRSCATT